MTLKIMLPVVNTRKHEIKTVKVSWIFLIKCFTGIYQQRV